VAVRRATDQRVRVPAPIFRYTGVTIEPNGTLIVDRVLQSVPGLDEAAKDAVRQWLYTPTLVNPERALSVALAANQLMHADVSRDPSHRLRADRP
jgi:hypothetical protein